MRSRGFGRSLLLLSLPASLVVLAGCSDPEAPAQAGAGGQGGTAGQGGASGQAGTGGGGQGGGQGGGAQAGAPTLQPGEVCVGESNKPTLSASASQVVVSKGKRRVIEVTARPDVCSLKAVSFKVADGSKAVVASVGGAVPASPKAAEAVGQLDLRHPTIPVEIEGLGEGMTTLEAKFSISEKDLTLTIPVGVTNDQPASCSGKASGKVNPGGKIGGTADVGMAELGLQDKADSPTQVNFEGTLLASPTLWKTEGFDAEVACSADIVPAGFKALGSAVTFGPEAKKFQRELPMAIPINPGLMPDKATLRHVRVVYSGPAFKAPRVVPVTDATIEASGGGWVLRFLAPRLGTYQAVVDPEAGTKTFKRRLTHRALIGVSMGGGGTASFGMRHHDKFDVLAPLGGPVDWTYMLDHIERNHVSGFQSNDGENVPKGLLPMPEPRVPYEHPSVFNQWWYEYPREGNGGSFARDDYSQIFRDLALMFGNPNGQNNTPGAEHLPPGVSLDHPAIKGDLPEGSCAVTVEPADGTPNFETLKKLQQQCPASRCKHTQVLDKFYDGRFNPKGKWPVITFCDGGPQIKSKSPYSNQWTKDSNQSPLDVALAVDYNGNGKRDEDEPVISQGHEPFRDFGPDGVPSAEEPGYEPGVNEDPAGDDYDPQYNPSGTELNGSYEQGEPFDDVGLDGVADTKDSPYDAGEGDGQFTMSKGLQRFRDHDAHAIIHKWSTPPGGVVDDKALQRLDIWTDGGYRDLFNFGAAAQSLAGTLAARGRPVAYYSRLTKLPGQLEGATEFSSVLTPWQNVPGSVLARYGFIDPTTKDINEGAGQHVGSVAEITGRLQTALYYITQRWPDAPRTLVEKSNVNPDPSANPCETKGSCTFEFTNSLGRKGPVTINLPPGYTHKDQQNTRYPVVYMLHGYGQSPEDLGAAIIFLSTWMNQSSDSSASRLGKAIMVYVDGRCRLSPDGSPECIRGTFYVDSPRETGGKLETWFLDLMNHIDKNYRTMAPSEVDWPAD